MNNYIRIFLIILFSLSTGLITSASSINIPTGLKLIEATDPEMGPTKLTFTYNEVEGADRYYIALGKTIGNYDDARLITENPDTFLEDKYSKGDTVYAVIKAAKIGYDSGESEYSKPIKFIMGGEIIKDTNNKIEPILNSAPIPKITKLPTTGPEHIFLIILSLGIGALIMRRKAVK